jgi:hypothetical protein
MASLLANDDVGDGIVDDDDVNLAMDEEEEVATSVTNVSYCPISSSLVGDTDARKCLWCQTSSDERESLLDRGLPTFQEHCQAAGRHDLLEYDASRHNEKLLVHRSCRRAMAYAARKATSAVLNAVYACQPVA